MQKLAPPTLPRGIESGPHQGYLSALLQYLDYYLRAIANQLDGSGGLETVTATPHEASASSFIMVDDDTIGGAATVNLPPASNAEVVYYIKKLGTTGSVTVDGYSAETIDGAATKVLSVQYDSVMIISDGTNWNIV